MKWEAGLKNTRDSEATQMVADELGLSVQVVKDWIGNRRSKQRKTSSEGSATTSLQSKPVLLKGPSAFNIFCKGKKLKMLRKLLD